MYIPDKTLNTNPSKTTKLYTLGKPRSPKLINDNLFPLITDI